MLESKFWALVKRNLPERTHTFRVENFTPGCPDVNIAYRTLQGECKEAWIELKVCRPGRKSVMFMSKQFAWMKQRNDVGGRVRILINHGDTLVLNSVNSEILELIHKFGKPTTNKRMIVPMKAFLQPENIYSRVFEKPYNWHAFWTSFFI